MCHVQLENHALHELLTIALSHLIVVAGTVGFSDMGFFMILTKPGSTTPYNNQSTRLCSTVYACLDDVLFCQWELHRLGNLCGRFQKSFGDSSSATPRSGWLLFRWCLARPWISYFFIAISGKMYTHQLKRSSFLLGQIHHAEYFLGMQHLGNPGGDLQQSNHKETKVLIKTVMWARQ